MLPKLKVFIVLLKLAIAIEVEDYNYGPVYYHFGYQVNDKDHYYGHNYQGHMEHVDGHTTTGEFKVKLPDGRVQITSYQADDFGYRPHITYAFDGHDPLPIVQKPHGQFIPGDVHQSPEIFTPPDPGSPPPPPPPPPSVIPPPNVYLPPSPFPVASKYTSPPENYVPPPVEKYVAPPPTNYVTPVPEKYAPPPPPPPTPVEVYSPPPSLQYHPPPPQPVVNYVPPPEQYVPPTLEKYVPPSTAYAPPPPPFAPPPPPQITHTESPLPLVPVENHISPVPLQLTPTPKLLFDDGYIRNPAPVGSLQEYFHTSYNLVPHNFVGKRSQDPAEYPTAVRREQEFSQKTDDPGQEYFLVSLGSTNEDKSPVYAILAKKKLQAS